jgi:glycosyltransferase involved in cell wall biosynthesis
LPRVIAVSTDVQSELVRCGAPHSNVPVVLNGIDPAVFRRDRSRELPARTALALSADDVVIGGVGRLEPQKRFDLLIQAFARLRQRFPMLRLVIVGDGSLRQPLEQQAQREGVLEFCRFTGHTNDVIGIHHAFDLFVQSSDYEGTPNAVLEAMALETPLVATDAGGTRELVRHGVDGVVVPTGQLAPLTAAIEEAIGDRARTISRAAAARHRVEVHLSFQARMKRVEAIYESLYESRYQSGASAPAMA